MPALGAAFAGAAPLIAVAGVTAAQTAFLAIAYVAYRPARVGHAAASMTHLRFAALLSAPGSAPSAMR